MYEFRRANCEIKNISHYSQLLQLCFPKSTRYTLEFLIWQYKENPWGEVIGFDAYYENNLVAHYVTIPVNALIEGEECPGTLSLNTATHPEHQGKGLFSKLATLTYEAAKQEGKRFVVGVANDNSTHGFVKKLGFQLVGQLDAKIFIGTPKLRTPQQQARFQLNWTTPSISWRLKSPILQSQSNSQFLFKDILFNLICVVLSFREAFLNKRSNYFSPLIRIWIGFNSNLKWNPILNLTLPNRFRPAPLNFIFKPLADDNLIINKDSILFEAIDFDPY